MIHIPFDADLLRQRKAFADKLLSFLTTERQFVDGALVVTLQAPFGSGKTFFLQNWKEDLQESRTDKPEIPRPIILTAWESDYCNDPLLALISAIHKELKDDEKSQETFEKIKNAMKDVGWFGLGLVNSFLAGKIGLNAIEAGQFAESKKEQRENGIIPDILESFESRQAALSTIKCSLKTLFAGEAIKAVIMVDELDRCRPDYAISYLETIKHIFDIPGLVFVLAVDHAQLQATAKSLFGDEMNFDEYLRKFVQRRIDLPEIEWNDGAHSILSFYYDKYINNTKRLTVFPAQYQDNIKHLFLAIKPNFRQSQEIFRTIGHLFSAPPTNQSRGYYWGYSASMILLSAFYVTHLKFFEKISTNALSLQEACSGLNKIIINIPDRSTRMWWMKVFAIGYITNYSDENEPYMQIFEVFKQLQYIEKDATIDKWRRAFSEIDQGWGTRFSHGRSPINKVCSYIKEIKSFG